MHKLRRSENTAKTNANMMNFDDGDGEIFCDDSGTNTH
jgi:hypothetical protein